MKLSLTLEEVQAIVMNHIRQTMSAEFNECEIRTYNSYTDGFCVLSVKQPESTEPAEQ